MPKAPRYRYRLGWRSLKAVSPYLSETKAKQLAVDLAEGMHHFGIDNPRVAAMFIAQCAEESGGFNFPTEEASGSEYEGRRDLGNTQPGDGPRYKGRSYIQITGRNNYAAISKALGVDFVKHPEKLAESPYASYGACWWWANHGLNQLARNGSVLQVTRVINGGTNGYTVRLANFAKAYPLRSFLTPKRRKP